MISRVELPFRAFCLEAFGGLAALGREQRSWRQRNKRLRARATGDGSVSVVARWPSRQFRAGSEPRKETDASGLPDVHQAMRTLGKRKEPNAEDTEDAEDAERGGLGIFHGLRPTKD